MFRDQIDRKLIEISENLDNIKFVESNFHTLMYFEGDNFRGTDHLTKMKEKKYGILFNKIPVYANSGLKHGEVKIHSYEN